MELDFKNVCKYTMSANEIRQFSECPRKRYYASRDCLALRTNTPKGNLLLGSAFHATLEYYYTELDKKIKEAGLVQPTIEECVNLFETIPVFDPEAQGYKIEQSDLSTYNCIVNLYKENIPVDLVTYEVIGCEVAFFMHNWPCDNVMYHGMIDMIVRRRVDGKVFFFEHKTCASFRPEIYSRFDIQLHIYSEYGAQEYGNDFGGMLLNQVKKAKTERGYDHSRINYSYDADELQDFYIWLKAKTEAAISPDNIHSPCNNYMSCKTCEYAEICMKYGYKIPKSSQEVIDDMKDADGNAMYMYDPREESNEGEAQ